MAADVKTRYNDAELEAFRTLIKEKIVTAQEQLELMKSAYRNDSNNGTDDNQDETDDNGGKVSPGGNDGGRG